MTYYTTEKIERIFFAPKGYTDDIHYDECDDECVCCGGCNCDGCTE